MVERGPTTPERLATIEAGLEYAKRQGERNCQRTEDILALVLEKIDRLDIKIEGRFNRIESTALTDAQELASLKNRGVGILTALGIAFTFAATAFSSFFSSLKEAIFG